MKGFCHGSWPWYALAFAAGLLGICGCHADPSALATETRLLRLGQTEIAVTVHTGPSHPDHPLFLVLHDDEDTAVTAGLGAVRARGGRLVEVRAQGRRLVAFAMAGGTWRFDPNRVFSEPGLEATLREHNGSAPVEVAAEVRRFAEEILALPDPGPLLVTLHNNADGGYSAASYLPGGDLAGDAAFVHLPLDADPDDFFFVTDPGLYDRLAAEGFAVVLQDNARANDDGSLSVWAGRAGIPYVNVETEHGHTLRQARMLAALSRVLAASR